MATIWFQNLLGLVEGILVCGMFHCFIQLARETDWIPDSLKRLPIPIRIVLCSLTVFLALLGVPKSEKLATGLTSLLPSSAVIQQSLATDNVMQHESDTFRFLDIGVGTNGTISLVIHRPPDSANVSQDVVIAATTDLGTQTWFALTNAVFAAGETNRIVLLSTNILGSCAITNCGFFAFCATGDTDGDGLEDWQERF